MANLLTLGRIVLALFFFCLPVFSVSFFGLYLLAGLTDILDGWVARKTGTASQTGAKLDTAADIAFAVVCLAKLLPLVELPACLWIWVGVICVIKIANIISGFVVQKQFVAVHSLLNKLTGLLLFLLPLTVAVLDIRYSGGLVCAVATLAAAQEGHWIRTGKIACV